MKFEVLDYSKYNKPPFLPGWMSKEQTLQLAKTPDKQLEDINIVMKHLSEQYSEEFFINNTELLDKRGRLLGVERQGMDNATYYKQQQLRILLNLNKSTIPDIIKILKTFYSAEIIHIRPNYPAGIEILHDGLAPQIDFNSFILETIGAGISFATKELIVFDKEFIIIKDKLKLKYWILDKIHYNEKFYYDGFVTYGGEYWNYKPKQDLIKLEDNYIVNYISKNEEGGFLLLYDEDYLLERKDTIKEDEAGIIDIANLTIFNYNYYNGDNYYDGSIKYAIDINNIII